MNYRRHEVITKFMTLSTAFQNLILIYSPIPDCLASCSNFILIDSCIVQLACVIPVVDVFGCGSRCNANQIVAKFTDDVADRQDEQNVALFEPFKAIGESNHVGFETLSVLFSGEKLKRIDVAKFKRFFFGNSVESIKSKSKNNSWTFNSGTRPMKRKNLFLFALFQVCCSCALNGKCMWNNSMKRR